MSLDKAIEHGKEKRKPYRGSKAIDGTCRNHGSCEWCVNNRKHKMRDRRPMDKEEKITVVDTKGENDYNPKERFKIEEMKSDICMNCADKSCYGYDHRITECEDFQPMTWGDKIRSESDEGLAGYCSMYVPCFLCPMTFECDGRQIGKDECLEKWISYIKSPAEVKDDEQ